MSLREESSNSLEFKRRIGPDPHESGAESIGCSGCPDFWELKNGDFAVIGIRITEDVANRLPATAGCGPDEEVVMLPRDLVRKAIPDLSKLA